MNTNINYKRLLLAAATLTGLILPLHAQQAITFCSGEASNTSGFVSISCGEVAVQTSVAKAVTVVNITEQYNEGVQQPFTPRDHNTNGITPLSVKMDVYPNPTTDGVTMESELLAEPLHYTLYNTNGQLMEEGNYNGGQHRIDMTDYVAGNYILRIANGNNSGINTYKIILVR